MAANNETGVLQPIGEIATLCRAHGALLHVDAVQALGKQPLDVETIGADLMTLSAHKIGGPRGAGALYVRSGLHVHAQLRGGGQELGHRAGTENAIGAIGFAAALDALEDEAGWLDRCARLHAGLEAALVSSGGIIFGQGAPRLPTTTAVRMPGVAAATQVMNLDLAGYAVSAGSACSSGKISPSHVLIAMGLDAASAAETIRVSIGWGTTQADVDGFLAAWRAVRDRLGAVRAA